MGIEDANNQLQRGLNTLANGALFAAPTREKIDNGEALASMHDRISEILQFYQGFHAIAGEITGSLGFAMGQYAEAAQTITNGVKDLDSDLAAQAREGATHVAEIVEELYGDASKLKEGIGTVLETARQLDLQTRAVSRTVIEMAGIVEIYDDYHPALADVVKTIMSQTDKP